MLIEPAARLRLLSHLQQMLRERLAAPTHQLFDQFERRLFDLAERSRSGTQQRQYFDGLRECQRKRAQCEQDFLYLAVAPLHPESRRALGEMQAPLALVELEELEETLAMTQVAAHAAQHLAVPLDALERRLAALADRAREPDEPAVLGPQALGQAFRRACHALDLSLEVRLVAYALFSSHILETLESTYAELNRELVAEGVLPALPAPSARVRAAPPPRPAARANGANVPKLVQEVNQLLAQRRPQAVAGPGLSREQLLHALARVVPDNDDPERLKRDLLAQSRHEVHASSAGFETQDEDSIDLIGQMFRFVRHDPSLPNALQPLLTRLHLPFLRAALMDPGVMQTNAHPARDLLDAVGDAALGWSPGTDPEQGLVNCLEAIADGLVHGDAAGNAGFEQALEQLNEHLAPQRRRAELAEHRAVEATLGRERLRIARGRVASLLDRRLQRYNPLPWVRQLIRGPWANYLVLAWLRHGETGAMWLGAMEFVEELLWCDEFGAGTTDRARLQRARARLEGELRAGLAAVAYHDRDVERLSAELTDFLDALLLSTSAPGFIYESDPTLGNADFSLSWSEHELEEQPAAESLDAGLLSQLRELPPGTWFEFGGRHSERAKLSWTSPFSGRSLFVNRNGLRVDEIPPERLADEIERGLTRVIESSRLIERALRAVIARLRDQDDDGQRSA